MAFCINCGQELVEGAKFCSKCGAEVNAPQNEAKAQRKTVYEGEIHKCPSCGEKISSFVSTCPSCGFELRGTSSSKALKDFVQKLENCSDGEQKNLLIRNFPIPNTKEDILEFLLLTVTNIENNKQNSTYQSWISKFEQCYEKANLSIVGSEDRVAVQRIYDKGTKEIAATKKNRQIPQYRFISITLAVVASALLLLITFAGSGFLANPRLLTTAIMMYISAGLTILYIKTDVIKKAIIISYIINIVLNFIFTFWVQGHLLFFIMFIGFLFVFLGGKKSRKNGINI